jgi:DNA (cytosine-5)-methyltransferase 1
MLTVGSLFSGIGGLDLGLERAGMKVIWQSEIDPYCNKVLKKHWPKVTNHGNIKNIDWTTIERPDVICGGYPCQPFSTAGKRQGTDDPRHLWPWVRDAISALQPSYAILENVRGHLSMGGLQVIGELAKIGYDAEWRVVSAAGLGAPHRRERIIIVAYASRIGSDGRKHSDYSGAFSQGQEMGGQVRTSGGDVPNNVGKWDGQHRIATNTATQSRVWTDDGNRKKGYDGWSWWETEPNVGRVADGISNRVDRLRGLGNAVVPQVAEYIGHLVMAAHNNT